MKKLGILVALGVLLGSCAGSYNPKEEAPYNQGRIKFKEVVNNGTIILYIVSIDSSEYLVNYKGGIYKID